MIISVLTYIFSFHNLFILSSNECDFVGGEVLETNTPHTYLICQLRGFTLFKKLKLPTNTLRKMLFTLFTNKEIKAQKK